MPEIKDTDWAYAAGFVDGEGCIAIGRSFVPERGRFYYSVQVVVTNRDLAVLEWFQRTWGGWVVPNSKPQPGAKARDAWNWRAPSGQSAEPFLLGIGEFLRINSRSSKTLSP